MKKQVNMVPALRFSEFDGEWKKRRIHEILSIGSGKDYKHLDVGDVPVFGTGGLMTMVNSYLHEGETVCIGRKGTIDKPMYYSGRIWTVDTLFYTHTFNDSNPKFVYNLFQRVNWKQHNEAGGVPSLSKSTIEQIQLCLPSLPEQQKIASFLSIIDDKIEYLKKKKAQLEIYKKGVMQQLFSQTLRFKDEEGNEYPDWEERALGEICKISTGSSNRVDSNLDGAYTFFDRSQDIRLSNRYLFDTEAIIVPGEGQEFIPKHFIGKFDLHQRTYAIMNFEPHIGKFLFYYIGFNSKHLNSHAVGSTVKSLRLPMFEKMPINLPTTAEQSKIANFLSAIDEKIAGVDQQIEYTKQFKKGLLQQMFV